MKKFLFLAIVFFYFQLCNAQELASQLQGKIYEFKDVDMIPQYPGGMEAFYKFIAKNFKTPEKEGLNGKVITSFIIEIDGSISNIKVLKDVGYGSGEEIVRVLGKTQKWTPASLSDVLVRVYYQFPITISTPE